MSRPQPIVSGQAGLIVNADDFGLHRSINRAIVEGHRDGIITSCSLMPLRGTSAFDDAVEIAHTTPTLDIGLHFTLVGVLGLPPGYSGFVREYLAGRFPASRIEDILSRQLDVLARAGIRPSHIDSHQHLHALPTVMRVVCKAASKQGIRAIRLPIERAPQSASLGRIAASRILGVFANASRAEIGRNGLWNPDCFLGMACSGHLTADKLLKLIDRAPTDGITEILCHPGADNTALGEKFSWGYDWQGELAALKDNRVRDRIAERGIALTSFADAPVRR